MRNVEVDAVVKERTAVALSAKRLVVNYYRIRRKLAWPLPVRGIDTPPYPVRGHIGYPWATWMLWALEERIAVLGFAGSRFGDVEAQVVAEREVATLASWDRFDQYGYPDLAFGHSVRTLVSALRSMPWFTTQTVSTIRNALLRCVDTHLPWIRERMLRPMPERPEEECEALLANIPVIGTLGLAMAARATEHADAHEIDAHAIRLIEATFDMRAFFRTEGVSYDGYVLDFVADWLAGLETDSADPILNRPEIDDILGQSPVLACPGNAMAVAPIGDVEPLEMPFHASAHAKLSAIRPRHLSLAWLAQCPLEWIRTDGLAAIADITDSGDLSMAHAPICDLKYATVLRSGAESTDTAVVVATPRIDLGHLQRDAGSIVIGTNGRWLIDDPGYQQYLKTSEREFTMGAGAHNHPIIDGVSPMHKAANPMGNSFEDDVLHTSVDLTRCYDFENSETTVRRTVWLAGNDTVVVADEIGNAKSDIVTYHWHGHPDAAWWVDDAVTVVTLETDEVSIRCLNADIDVTNVDRLPGSRGQLSVKLNVPLDDPLSVPKDVQHDTPDGATQVDTSVIWWLFTVNQPEDTTEPLLNGRILSWSGRRFDLDQV
jgi:hypothetical protein